MMNAPEFKPNFKYSNVGNVVGTLVYAKALEKNDTGEPFGHEFLINSKGYGSVNVRVPMLEKSQYAMDNYPVEDKPRVRLGLTQLSQFVTDQGKVYTNTTSFLEMTDAVKVDGSNMPDAINGRFGGEVMNIAMEGNIVKLQIVSYNVDKEGKRITKRDGTPIDPEVVSFEVHKPELVQQFQQNVRQGMNIEVGYNYINKDDVTYDEYGFPVGSGDRIERVEVGKVIIHESQSPGPQGNMRGFGGQQQSNQQQQQGGFGGQQQQNQQGQTPFGNHGGQQQQQGQQNPFPGSQEMSGNDPLAQQANQVFGQNNNQGGSGFSFGN